MASLFDEFHNGLLANLWTAMAAVQRGEKLTRSDIRKQLREGFNRAYAADSDAEDSLIDACFTFAGPKGEALCTGCIYSDPLPPSLDDTDRRWLSGMLRDPAATLFLSPELLEKLKNLFPGAPSRLSWKPWHDRPDTLENPTSRAILATYISALLDKKQVLLTEAGKVPRTGTPVRLSYNLATDRYDCILRDGTFHRVPLSRVASLEKLPADAEDVEERWETFLTDHRTSFTLRMKDQTNAIERCFSLFSSYDKESWREGEDIYMLEIFYYDFDKEEILRNILSLGPSATVVEPEGLRQEVIHILTKEYERFPHA